MAVHRYVGSSGDMCCTAWLGGVVGVQCPICSMVQLDHVCYAAQYDGISQVQPRTDVHLLAIG